MTIESGVYEDPSTTVVATDSIYIQTFTAASKIIDAITIGIVMTPYVSYGPLNSLTISRTNNIVGQSPTYTFSFQVSSISQNG